MVFAKRFRLKMKKSAFDKILKGLEEARVFARTGKLKGGRLMKVDADKLTVDFETPSEKRVIDSFVEQG